MPQVIAYVASVLVSWGFSAAAATWVATIVVNAAVMFGAQKLLANKSKFGEFATDVAERTQMIRQSLAPRRLVYGRAKVSGVMVYAKETGTKREFLHMVLVLASHECDSVMEYWVNDEIVPFVGNQPDPAHRYYGFLRINAHLGTAAQAADTDLVAECGGEWTTDHKLSGHTYLAIRVKWDETKFPAGIPTIAATLKGKKVLDPRTSTTYASDNPALCIYDFMRDAQYGLGAQAGEFDTASVQAAANVCDESVGLAVNFTRQCDYDSGNKLVGMTTQADAQMDGLMVGMRVGGVGIPAGSIITSIHRDPVGGYFFAIDKDPTSTQVNTALTFGDQETRYLLNGTIDTSTKAGDTIEAMLSAMAGKVIYAGGKWYLHAGAYQTPTITLDEDDLRGPINVATKLSRRELANKVKGFYVSEADGWQLTDFPSYAPALYLIEDEDDELPRDIQLPFTLSASMAQRLAKIELERIRQQIVVRLSCKLTALKIQCGDNILLNNTRHGFVNKVFEVTSFVLVPYKDDAGNPCIGVDLMLRETASGVWDWADGEETTVDLSPNTTLHNPFVVQPPTGLTLLADATTAFVQTDGTIVPRLKVSWTAPDDQYVLSGGFIRMQYKKNGSFTWLEWTRVKGDVVEDLINDVESGEAYDVRIRAETGRGIFSAWVEQLNYSVLGDLVACDPVSGLSATAVPESIRLAWTLPDVTIATNFDLFDVEIYEAGSSTPAPNSGTTPTFKVGKVTTFTRDNLAAGATGYYWARTVDTSRNKSAWVGPVSATAGAGAATANANASAALAAASGAVTTANGKNKAWYQTTAPGSGMAVNDLWFDTDDNFKIYVWSGSAWVASFLPMLSLDGSNNITGLVKADGTTRDWVMVANKFQIWDGSSAYVPFEIVLGQVRIKDALIQTLDAGKIVTGNLTATVNITTGGLTAASGGANEAVMNSSGLRIGNTGGNYMKLGQYSPGSAGLLLYNSSAALKGFLVHQGGATTLDGGGSGSDTIQNFQEVKTQIFKAFSSANPHTTDAPISTNGGAWIGADIDLGGKIRGPSGGGSQSAPVYTMSNTDLDTGIYSDEAGKIKFTCNSTQMGRFVESAGSMFFILDPGCNFRFGVSLQNITTETVQKYITVQDVFGATVKLAVVQ